MKPAGQGSGTSQPGCVQPARRVVLLGASNLARGFSTVVETSRLMCGGGPLDIMTAIGHGRSYGIDSTVMRRTLPGISVCGLWEALSKREPAPTAALISDIGNDLLYEVPSRQIAAWVEMCLDRLLAVDAQVVMTLLPVQNLSQMSPLRFHLMRKVLFPRSRLPLETIRAQAIELNELVRILGHSRGVRLVEHQTAWYGIDPIHIKVRHWRRVWREVLSTWSDAEELPGFSSMSPARWYYLRRLRPQYRRVRGLEQRQAQPAGRLRDGSTISLY